VLVDLGPELHLLDDDVRGLLSRFLAPLLLLVLVPAVVHDPAHRRVRVRGYLDEIELFLPGDCEGLREGLDPQLLTLGADEQDLACSDPVVDPGVVCGYVITSLLALLDRGHHAKMADSGSPPSGDRWGGRDNEPGLARPGPGRVGRVGKAANAGPTSQLGCEEVRISA
jgi:hypothetical protein